MKVEDTLTVTFDRDYEAGICVSRVVNGKIIVLKIEVGEQADILYHLLTEQTTKAEIKAESEDGMTDKNLCDSCTNTGCMFQSDIIRTKCDFYVSQQADIQKALKESSKDISENVLAIVREEYISKAEYEKRLKADFVTVLDKIRAEIEQLPTKTRTNWDGCCLDIDYPEIEYVDVTKNQLLGIIDKYKAESEGKK